MNYLSNCLICRKGEAGKCCAADLWVWPGVASLLHVRESTKDGFNSVLSKFSSLLPLPCEFVSILNKHYNLNNTFKGSHSTVYFANVFYRVKKFILDFAEVKRGGELFLSLLEMWISCSFYLLTNIETRKCLFIISYLLSYLFKYSFIVQICISIIVMVRISLSTGVPINYRKFFMITMKIVCLWECMRAIQ